MREPLRLILQVWPFGGAGNIARHFIKELDQVPIRAMELVGRPVPAVPIDPPSGITKLPRAPLEGRRAGAAEGGVPETGDRRLGERKRGALVVAIAAQIDRLALLADDLEAQHIGEEALAFLGAWGEQLDMREMGDIVDWLVDVFHGDTPNMT
jgi:hypothetical protein